MKTSGFPARGWLRLTLSIAPLFLLCASCSLRLPVPQHQQANQVAPPPHSPSAAQASSTSVWLISDNYHTGMVFPYAWLLDCGFVPPDRFPENTECVAMSWGNQDAYSTQGIDSPWKWFRVLFTPTSSVMELIPVNGTITEVLPKQAIWVLPLDRNRGYGLAQFLNGCSQKKGDGSPIVVTSSSWGDGVQLAGSYPYFIPRVCNIWTAQAIESMGYPVNLWQGITADSLIRQSEGPSIGFQQIWAGKRR
jgi:hypothetical protein